MRMVACSHPIYWYRAADLLKMARYLGRWSNQRNVYGEGLKKDSGRGHSTEDLFSVAEMKSDVNICSQSRNSNEIDTCAPEN